MTSTELLRRSLDALITLDTMEPGEMWPELSELISDIRAFLPPQEITVIPNEIELRRGRFSTPPEPDINQQRPIGDYLTGLVPLERYLGCDTLHIGSFVKLTSGQRSVLRDDFGMTPTAIVEVVGYDFYSNVAGCYEPAIVSGVTIRSIAPALTRKHILSLVRIPRFGEFLQRAADREVEAAETSTTSTKSTKEPSQRAKEIALLAEYA